MIGNSPPSKETQRKGEFYRWSRWFRFIFFFVVGIFLSICLAWLATGKFTEVTVLPTTLKGTPWGIRAILFWFTDQWNRIDQNLVILSVFGWFGGLIYSFIGDKRWSIPTAGGDIADIQPGFLGDVLTGVAGAFVAYAFVPPQFIEPIAEGAATAGSVAAENIDTSRLVVVGIVGGYGAKAILKATVGRFVQRVNETDLAELLQRIKQADQQNKQLTPDTASDSEPPSVAVDSPPVDASGPSSSEGETTPTSQTEDLTAPVIPPAAGTSAVTSTEVISVRPNVWDTALAKAPSIGASAVTARQDGLAQGKAASEKMAQTDLQRILSIKDNLERVGAKSDIPPAVLAAIASRESRAGKVLQGGYGDGGNAFGIMQVDLRHHDVKGIGEGPNSQAHLEQAAEILADYRQAVRQRHPNWEPEYVLKGAIVAYNSGVSNVRTKVGLDKGTTGNDYGSDVVARARFFSNHLKSLAECLAATAGASIAMAEVVPIQSAIDILKEVEGEIFISDWGTELNSAVEAALIHLKLLKSSGNPNKLKVAWTKFKSVHNQANPDSIGEGSARLLMDALGEPHAPAPEQTPTGAETVNQNAGSRTGKSRTLPTGELVYESEYILPNIPLTWGECTKGMQRWPTQRTEVDNARKLAKAFGEVRRQYGKPLIITSGFRPEPINSQVGGSSRSQHISFKALDIHPTDGDYGRLLQILRGVQSIGGIGLGQHKGFLHMDIRNRINGKPVEWPY